MKDKILCFQNEKELTFLEGLSESKYVYAGLVEKSNRQFLKTGTPFVIEGDSTWYFVKDTRSVGEKVNIFFFELPYRLKGEIFLYPLNQFDNGFSNGEILHAAKIYINNDGKI